MLGVRGTSYSQVQPLSTYKGETEEMANKPKFLKAQYGVSLP